MSCIDPCQTCTSLLFNSCTSCNPSLLPTFSLSSTSYTLTSSLCLVEPTWYIQLTCSCMFFLFILMPLVRKRCLVLVKIFDIVQIIGYFKYINGYVMYRHNFLYMEMRAMTPWSQGWNVVLVTGDLVAPVYVNQETFANKLIRIAAVYLGVFVLVVVVGVVRICCREGKIQFGTFFAKNIKNALSLALYFTIQDTAFFCAANFYALTSTSTFTYLSIIYLSLAFIFSIAALLFIFWASKAVNYDYEHDKQNKLYNYELMFLYRMDYDLFLTYELTNIPKRKKQTERYSNLALMEFVRKIGYAFLICSFLFKTPGSISVEQQIYQLLGYIIFWQVLWYIALPFDPKTQVVQLIINILADLILLTILVFPLINNTSSVQLIHLVLCLSLFLLAIVSVLLQIFRDLYTFIPYDLYGIGLTVVIEDTELRKQLERRKKQQESNERVIEEMRRERARLEEELRKKKQLEEKSEGQSQRQREKSKKEVKKTSRRQHDSEIDLNQSQKNVTGRIDEDPVNQENYAYPVASNSDGESNLDEYKIDTKKKRLVYNYNRKKPFLYSNKLDE